MRKIRNPFLDMEGYNCFGCCPGNETGLRMRFYEDGEDIVSLWRPASRFQGYGNVLHGGIQAALLDEIASWVVFIKLSTSGVTSNLSIDFIKTVFTTGGEIALRARLLSREGRTARIQTELSDSGNQVCSRAVVTYAVFPEALARKKLSYPGREAFFRDDDSD